jgi:spore protease
MRQLRTDLAVEAHAWRQAGPVAGVEVDERRDGPISLTVVRICSEDGAAAMSRPCGTYVTLACGQIANPEPALAEALAAHLAKAMRPMLPPEGDVLVVGLGNRRVTPDALGPRVTDAVLVTRHLRDAVPDSLRGRLRPVSAVAPGVLGSTGMETAEMIRGVVSQTKPVAVVAVDALAARESERICCTVQVTDTGINPGSGVGNHRRGITRETLGVPVIAVGVPMVVYAATIARDALTLLVHDLQLEDGEHEQALDALTERVVSQRLGDLVVTPREVDAMVERMAFILARGINTALQPGLRPEEVAMLMQ